MNTFFCLAQDIHSYNVVLKLPKTKKKNNCVLDMKMGMCLVQQDEESCKEYF